MTISRICSFVAMVALLPLLAVGDEKKDAPLPETVSYHRDIRPIFQAHCQGCHQPAKAGGKLVMSTFEGLFKAAESGEVPILAGQPEKSPLVVQITPKGADKPAMPKDKDPLSARQIQLITKWVAQGAKNDTPASTDRAVDMDHPPVYEMAPIVTSLDFSKDGKTLAVSGYHEVLLHSVDAILTQDAPAPIARLVGLSERIESVRFSPDGAQLAVVGGSPGRFGEVQVWDVANRKLTLSTMITFDTIYGASWSHDGTRIAFGCSDNTLRVIDAKTGKQVLFQGAHSDWVLSTIWSKDSSHLVSVSRDRSMKLTHVETQRFIDNISSITPGALKGGLMAVDRNPMNDELLIGGSDGTPKIYQMHRTKPRQIGDDFNLIRAFDPLPGRVFAARYNHDGTLVSAGSSFQSKGEVRVYQSADAKLVAKLEGQQGAVFALALSPDSKQLASGGFDGKVRLNDPQTGKLIKEFTPVAVVAKVAGN